MINDAEMLEASATMPIRSVPTAPPNGVIISSDDAILVFSPRPLTDMAKIVGNIIASNA